jgi:hypothetical protein
MEVCLPRRCPGTLINNAHHQIQIPFFFCEKDSDAIQCTSFGFTLILLCS